MATPGQDSIVDRLIQWEAGATPGPWGIVLIPTNRCNQRCRMCWQRWVESEHGRLDYSEVSDERLIRLVDEAADLGVREWTITGGGEPMTRGQLVMDLCKRIRARGMNGGMHTNGTLLGRERIDELVKIGWGCIHFSVDGPDAATNDSIRSDGAFERARRSMLALAELRLAHGSEWPLASLNTVITNANFDKLDKLIQFAREMQCSAGLYLSLLVVHDESSAQFRLSSSQEAALPEMLDKAAALADSLGLPHNCRSLQSDKQNDEGCNAKRETNGLVDAVCFEAWINAAVLPDGRVGPCCMFWEEDADKIHDKTLREAWLGPYMQRVRQRLAAHTKLPAYCRLCHSGIPPRTEGFRNEMRSRQWDRWPRLSWEERARFIADRISSNVREHGLRETARRAQEWARVRRDRRSIVSKDKQ